MIDPEWIDLAIIEGTTFQRTISVFDYSQDPPAPVSLSGMTISFRVFTINATPVIDVPLTIVSPSSGQGILTLTPDNYASLIPGTPYMHDFRLLDTAGGESVLAQGAFSIIEV